MAVCPVCRERQGLTLDSRKEVPIAQNLVFLDHRSARQCAVGKLDVLRCRCCGFVWNNAFDPKLMRYDATYDNDQNFSEVFRTHVSTVAEAIEELAPQNPCLSILEIGCGQGDFLSLLRQRFGERVTAATGFDPAFKSRRGAHADGVEFIADYFGLETASRLAMLPDIVVSRHTIEHVPEPMAFLSAIRRSCKPGTMVFIETPNVEWVLDHGVFFDLYYEHCSLFTPASLRFALEKADFVVDDVRSVFGGQYMLAIARTPTGPVAGGLAPPAPTLCNLDDRGYAGRREAYLEKLLGLIRDATTRGKVALWGGASKGVTLALLLGKDSDLIACAIDMNVRKQGAFMPRTAILIASPEEAYRLGVTTAIVVNPAYTDEIRAYCAAKSLRMQIIPVE